MIVGQDKALADDRARVRGRDVEGLAAAQGAPPHLLLLRPDGGRQDRDRAHPRAEAGRRPARGDAPHRLQHAPGLGRRGSGADPQPPPRRAARLHRLCPRRGRHALEDPRHARVHRPLRRDREGEPGDLQGPPPGARRGARRGHRRQPPRLPARVRDLHDECRRGVRGGEDQDRLARPLQAGREPCRRARPPRLGGRGQGRPAGAGVRRGVLQPPDRLHRLQGDGARSTSRRSSGASSGS